MFESQFTIPHLHLKDIIRIFNKVQVSVTRFHDGTPCWEWTRRLNKGYGSLSLNGNVVLTHRVIYAWLVGPLPSNFYEWQLDHLCRNRACCNPCHLELVTKYENYIRGESSPARCSRQQACTQGHPFSPQNTIYYEDGRRICRICLRDRNRIAQSDPEKRPSLLQYKRETHARQMANPEFREQKRQRDLSRYHEQMKDPALREHKRLRQIAYREKKRPTSS